MATPPHSTTWPTGCVAQATKRGLTAAEEIDMTEPLLAMLDRLKVPWERIDFMDSEYEGSPAPHAECIVIRCEDIPSNMT